MRIGSAITILLGLLVGFGYLFSDNMHTRKDLAEANQRIASLLRVRDAIQGQLDGANSEVAALTAQNDELKRQGLLLDGQIKQIQEENLRINNENAKLQTQLDEMKKLNPVIENLVRPLPKSLKLALLVPILPVSLAATFIIYRYNQHHSSRKNNQPKTPKRHVSVKLTEEEMKEIIQMRRKL